MRELSFNEVRKIQIEMLSDFHYFCERNNLRYFLDAGSLLGAVRHNGFIPWDDDVDVAMPRCDYDKFIEFAKDGYKNSILHLPINSIETYLKILDKRTLLIESPNTVHRQIGVYIDVYPKDGIRKVGVCSEIRCEIVRLLSLKIWFNKVSIYKWKKSSNIFKRIIAYLGRLLIKNKNRELFWLIKLSKKYQFDSSEYAATIQSGGLKNCVSRKYLDKYVLHDFEGLKLQIPVGYNEYLTKLYGDYMTLPPKEEQHSHHDYVTYWIDNANKEIRV